MGVTPGAETHDRAAAYALRERLERWLHENATEAGEVAVCTDVWWLNNDDLRAVPTISVGAPESNALTAYLASRIPSAFAVEGVMVVQVDLDFADLLACCWGRDHASTAGAVEAFAQRYLEDFMSRAVARAAS